MSLAYFHPWRLGRLFMRRLLMATAILSILFLTLGGEANARPSHEKRDAHHEKRDSRHEKRDAHHEKRDSRHEKRDSRHDKYDSRYEKHDSRPGKKDSENTLVRMEQCLRAATDHVPGKVRDLEFEIENGIPYYEFEIVDSKKQVYDVECNARTGKITSTNRETRDVDTVFRSQAKISEKQAREKALSAHPGTIIDTEMIIDDHGNALYEFEIRTKHQQVFELNINATTGEIVSVKRIHYSIP